jgi:hypothetical protein
MAAEQPAMLFKLDDRVKIRHSSLRGRIVELRGALGPGGAYIYRVRWRRKPPAYIEVREDQLELIPPEAGSCRERLAAAPAQPTSDGRRPEDLAMPAEQPAMRFKLGDRVKIHHWAWSGRIVELRGALGPGGANVYRVRYKRKPRPRYIEVREDQLELIPPAPEADPKAPDAGS